jgi:hypothetical protein
MINWKTCSSCDTRYVPSRTSWKDRCGLCPVLPEITPTPSIISDDKRNYTVFIRGGFATVTHKGAVVECDVSLHEDINQRVAKNLELDIKEIKRGAGYDDVMALRCAPVQSKVKKSDMTNLGTLFTPIKKVKRQRGVLHMENLKPISEENRFKGRDWEADRETIQKLMNKIENRNKKNKKKKVTATIAQIAKELGVPRSTLSKAAKRYSLFCQSAQNQPS